eukprot:201367-Pyramimonas_sp.AAC.1
MPPRTLASPSATRCSAVERMALFCPAYVSLDAIAVTEHVCPPFTLLRTLLSPAHSCIIMCTSKSPCVLRVLQH